MFQAAQAFALAFRQPETVANPTLMERRRLADIVKINKIMLNQLFGDEPSPLHFRFQAAFGLGKVCKRRAQRHGTLYGCGRLGSLKRQYIQQKTPFGVASNGFQAACGL